MNTKTITMNKFEIFFVCLVASAGLSLFTLKTLELKDSKKYYVSKDEYIFISDEKYIQKFKLGRNETKESIVDRKIDYRLYKLAQEMDPFTEKIIVHNFCRLHKEPLDEYLEKSEFVKKRNSENINKVTFMGFILFAVLFLALKYENLIFPEK